MPLPAGLDPDLLRAFIYVAEEQNFTRAGARVGRTQAAISMQMRKLEDILGKTLLKRGRGEGIELTPHGQYLLSRARELLVLNDSIWSAFQAPEISGKVRLGTPDDYALQFLPGALRRFAQTHPAVEVEVVCLPSTELMGRLKAGQLDLSLISEGHETRNWPAQELIRGPLAWITSTRFAPHKLDPLPLALAEHDCSWRRAALRGLDEAHLPYRIAYVSGSAIGSLVPVLAGLAVTCGIPNRLPEGTRALRPGEDGLPKLPDFCVLMLKGKNAPQPVTDRLAEHIEDEARREAQTAGWAA
ncbi:LysR substrate-binding domain-containing protein [Acidocella facilis]|uniref:LysR substrate-binding domain-containing protein n=1 Tax=Acidocella facilis TaxID=525 RepID=UPI00047BD8E2|nr:LysR substrate-binding domain-containing protein [Acidocella facilis]